MADTREAKLRKTAERQLRAQFDPWHGKRRDTGEMGRDRTKAGRSKAAARGRSYRDD